MERVAMDRVVDLVSKRMMLDYAYFLAFRAAPEKLLLDIETDADTRRRIAEAVKAKVGSEPEKVWARLTGCGICNGLELIT